MVRSDIHDGAAPRENSAACLVPELAVAMIGVVGANPPVVVQGQTGHRSASVWPTSFRELVLPELHEPPLSQRSVPRCALQVAMAEIVGQRTRIVAIVC